MEQTDDRSSQEHGSQTSFRALSPPVDEGDADFILPGRVEERRGSRLGDVRVRIVRPTHPEFRRVSRGGLEATEAAYTPHGRLGKAVNPLTPGLSRVPPTTAPSDPARLTNARTLAALSFPSAAPVA